MGLGHYLGGPDRFCPPLRAAARWRGYAHEGRGDEFPVGGKLEFTTPAAGPDWVLVLDDDARRFGPPGGRSRP
jgi:hypothetical protein